MLMTPLAWSDEWPTLHHDFQRTGRTADQVNGPYETKWVKLFDREILTTRMEAIVAQGKVFVGTYAGRLHALDAANGEEVWNFQAAGPILHSPCYAEGTLYVASAGSDLVALDAQKGKPKWTFHGGKGGFDTSPTVADGLVLIGGRDGGFYAVNAAKGKQKWTLKTDGPIRTTAAVFRDAVVFASDDMHAYSAAIATGEQFWKSEKLMGQSLRDYYPVVFEDVGVVAFRTNPVRPMPQQIGRDRSFLCQQAGVDDSDWRKVDAFIKSDQARGTPEKIAAEQVALHEYLERDAFSQTFYAFNIGSGKQRYIAPILWAAGCQGVGIPPVMTPRGEPIVYYRTAYSNFNLGVAPLVGLGYLDPSNGSLEPIFHAMGAQVPWNTFWGTADESMNFAVGGNVLYVTHQGTLSGLDLNSLQLFHIAGNRDTWGGEKSLPWARNEWHGPARGSVAIADDTLYWLTGSRVIAVKGVKANAG